MKQTNENGVYGMADDEAYETFVRRAAGDWNADQERTLQARMQADPAYAEAFSGMEKSWRSLGAHAESPELMKLRESAISWARHENQKRWGVAPRQRRKVFAAGLAAAVLALVVGLQLSPYGYHPGLYRTGIGQQTKVDLVDRSQIELDAVTRLQVRFTDTERTVRLLEGQAQFSVAKDPQRPFRVLAGDQKIVAVGTVFTVEYIDGKVRVTTLEGKVAVSSATKSVTDGEARHAGATESTVALTAGEALRVGADGSAEFLPKAEADVVAATAWREGNVIFKGEPLGDAVRRLNRYSHLKLTVAEPSLAELRISGVFQKGDSAAFARTVQAYYAVIADETDSDVIRLRLK
ncbi:FecR family protein [Steroidobacter sp.]|uniref:FecR family protein n=1 Tax=Steroidobacter sp. TaxID=1978227 RepID=UPI001A3BCD26|nr:FecR domain-containing protein [Steroidobacter sp.]MBL8268744.1 FecR domain-containing protein [Steroidobacter sp.]